MFGLFGGSGDRDRRLESIERRLAEIERKLDALLRYAGFDAPSPGSQSGGPPLGGGDPRYSLPAHVREAADSDRKIEAIKVYREATGLGLKEAKDAVEAYLADRGR